MNAFGPDELLDCYRRGVFPMAESRDDEALFILDPEWRCILPLERFHVPRRLARTVRADPFEIAIDRDFDAMVAMCAEEAPDREDTWINDGVRWLYGELHARGYAHSIETRLDGELVGGLYGVALGGAFFGESMASRVRDASKVALVHLAARLCAGRFALLDAQFMSDHLKQFGAMTIPRHAFQDRLNGALACDADFFALPLDVRGAQALQSIAQMSYTA